MEVVAKDRRLWTSLGVLRGRWLSVKSPVKSLPDPVKFPVKYSVKSLPEPVNRPCVDFWDLADDNGEVALWK